MSEETVRHKPIDKWIPWFFVLFFIVVAVLDSIFVTLAVKTHTGVVTDNAYERGLDYNQTLKSVQSQAVLGWQSEILYEDKMVRFVLKDKDSQALQNAAVIAKITRPVQDGYDFEIALEETDGGVYIAQPGFPLTGQWNIRIFATWQDIPYQSSKMIIIR